MTGRPQPRESIALMEGYHSPQLDVTIRLNTNEAPVSPPAKWLHDVTEALADVEWHRYPDRGAAELRDAIAAAFERRRNQADAQGEALAPPPGSPIGSLEACSHELR